MKERQKQNAALPPLSLSLKTAAPRTHTTMLVIALPNGRSFAVDAPADATPDALRAAVEKATGERERHEGAAWRRAPHPPPRKTFTPPPTPS